MPTVLKNDEINKLRSIPYKEFFEKMQITKSQMRERIALAEDIEDLMLVLFVLLPEYIDRIDELKESTYSDLLSTVSKIMVVDDEIDKHLKELTEEVIDVSVKNIDGDEYWLSQDRAMFIAENESNTVFNHYDYMTAIRNGYKRKRWLTELDNKVRKTHIVLEQETIPIEDMFIVGGSLMRYPRDSKYMPDLGEVIGCRCVAEYLP